MNAFFVASHGASLGVYGYLLPQHVPFIVKEALCCPRNDLLGATERVRTKK